MRARQVKAIVVIALIVGTLAGCGGSETKSPEPDPGKTVSGETETGMKLKVETFVDPAEDPALKELDGWRASHDYPAVDYHRVTADNTQGVIADSGRTLRFARDANAIAAGQGLEARFTCDALQFEWVPRDDADTDAWDKVRSEVCADGPPKQDGIQPGDEQVYFLFTDRNFEARGLRDMQVFGPRDSEFN